MDERTWTQTDSHIDTDASAHAQTHIHNQVGEDAGDIPELLSRDDISEDVAQPNATPQDSFYQFVVSDDANILFNISLPLHAPWTDMRSQLQLYTPIYGTH